MNSEIAVSVGIPCYNCAPYVEKCARSLFSQTLQNMEFIFVDDASSDDSLNAVRKVLAEFPARCGQVKFFTHSVNQGPAAARMTAKDAFTGKYFIFCDSDDYVEPEMYETMYRKAECTHADVVHCGFTMHHTNGRVNPDCELADLHDLRDYLCAIATLQLSPFLVTHLFRRDTLSWKNLYSPGRFSYTEDLLLLVQLLRQCRTVACCTEKGYYHYLRRNSSISHINAERNMRQCGLILYYLDRTERDPEILAARKTHWRNYLYTALRYKALSKHTQKVFLRYCIPGVLKDRHLKFKKKIKLLLAYMF